jgi:hypothetical protein
LYKEGYVYVPDSCMSNGTNSNNCQLHVSFHGCEQTIDDIGQQFLLETGYNRWAAVNNLIILYPQVWPLYCFFLFSLLFVFHCILCLFSFQCSLYFCSCFCTKDHSFFHTYNNNFLLLLTRIKNNLT